MPCLVIMIGCEQTPREPSHWWDSIKILAVRTLTILALRENSFSGEVPVSVGTWCSIWAPISWTETFLPGYINCQIFECYFSPGITSKVLYPTPWPTFPLSCRLSIYLTISSKGRYLQTFISYSVFKILKVQIQKDNIHFTTIVFSYLSKTRL